MEIKYFFGILFFLFLIYKMFFSPVKTYNKVISRGYYYHIIGLKKKEISLYLTALDKVQLTKINERDLKFVIGLWYEKNKEYSMAAYYFDQAFQNYDKSFPYKKEFIRVIDSYIQSNQMEKAKEILEFFLKRKPFDKRLIKLEMRFIHLL